MAYLIVKIIVLDGNEWTMRCTIGERGMRSIMDTLYCLYNEASSPADNHCRPACKAKGAINTTREPSTKVSSLTRSGPSSWSYSTLS